VSSTAPVSVLQLKGQGPMYLVGVAHGTTHWVLGVFYILIPVLRGDLGLSYTQAGLLVSILHTSSFIGNLGSGALTDVLGRRTLLKIIALVGGSGALFTFGVTGWYPVLCAMVAVLGAANTLWHPPAFAFMAERYPDHRGYALSIHATGASLGDMIAPLAAGFILLHLSWQHTAMVGAAPGFVMAVVVALLLLPKDRTGSSAAGERLGMAAYVSGLVAMLKIRSVLGLCLMAAFRSMGQSGLMLFLPLYVADVMGANPVLVGSTVMAMHLGGAIVSPIAGVLSDRMGRRPIVMAGLSGSTVAIVGLTFLDSTTAFVIGVSVLGFVLFGVRPVIQSWMMDVAPSAMHGSATSVLFGAQSLFSMSIPVVGGAIADAYGLLEVFYLIAAALLVANLTVFMLPKSSDEKP